MIYRDRDIMVQPIMFSFQTGKTPWVHINQAIGCSDLSGTDICVAASQSISRSTFLSRFFFEKSIFCPQGLLTEHNLVGKTKNSSVSWANERGPAEGSSKYILGALGQHADETRH